MLLNSGLLHCGNIFQKHVTYFREIRNGLATLGNYPSSRIFVSVLHIKFLSFCLFLAVLGLHCCVGFTLVVEGAGRSPVAVCSLPIVVASLVALTMGSRSPRLQQASVSCGPTSCSSRALEHRLNSCTTWA